MNDKAVSVALGVVLLGTGLLGCASRTVWTNSRVAPNMQQHQFTLDSTECVALANTMIPEPAKPQPQQGRIVLRTPDGPVYGTYQSHPPISTTAYTDAYQAGRRKAQRRDYEAACMAQRGWQRSASR